MKKLLVIAIAVSLCASAAVAGDYYPTKDAGINKWYQDVNNHNMYSNTGAGAAIRFMKGRENFMLLDFDWAAIEADLLANPGYHAEFSMVPADSGSDTQPCQLILSEHNTLDWVEGDGPDRANFNWTNPTVNHAPTSHSIQTLEDAANPGWPLPAVIDWPWSSFDGKRGVAGFKNANDLIFSTAGIRVSTVLDPVWLGHLIAGTTPDANTSVGFYTRGDLNLNTNGYTREAALINRPMVSVVPEPATMALLAIGGLALIRRRR